MSSEISTLLETLLEQNKRVTITLGGKEVPIISKFAYLTEKGINYHYGAKRTPSGRYVNEGAGTILFSEMTSLRGAYNA